MAMAISIGLSVYSIAAKGVERKVEEDLQLSSKIASNHLHNFIENLSREIRSFSKGGEIEKYFETGRNELLHQYFLEKAPSLDFLSYVDNDGQEITKVVQGELTDAYQNLSSEVDYLATLQNPDEIHVSSPRFDEKLKKDVLLLDYIITDVFGDRIGYLRAGVSLQQIHMQLQSSIINQDNLLYIIDRHGKIVYMEADDYEKPLSVLQEGFPLWDVYSVTRDVDEYEHTGMLFGKDALIAMTTMPQVGWKIYVVNTLDELMQDVVQLRNLIFLISVLTILLGEFISRLVGISITDPIEKFTVMTAKIAESGILNARVDWQSKDELGQLASNFNAMLGKMEAIQGQLAEEEQFVNNIITSIPDTLCVIDNEGNIVKINPSLKLLLGYEENELLGRAVILLFPDETLPFTLDHFQQFPDSQPLCISEGRYLHKDGTPIHMEITIAALTDENEVPWGMVLIGMDIREKKMLAAERRKAQQRLKETQKELLQTEKMAVVGQMSGMVAHEVLNPISAVNVRVALNLKNAGELVEVVKVLTQIISDWQQQHEEGTLIAHLNAAGGTKELRILSKIASALSKNQKERCEDLEFIEKLVHRVIKTIDGLREMSKHKRELGDVPLQKLVDEVILDMSDGLKKRNILITKDYVADVVVTADYMEIYSVVSNLLRNAMQAIDKHLDADTREIRVQLHKDGEGKALIQIQDSGIGMDKETVKNVFTPGFTSKGRKGTGIGLSFTRKLVLQYGGNIIVLDSEPGKGTTFQITLTNKQEK